LQHERGAEMPASGGVALAVDAFAELGSYNRDDGEDQTRRARGVVLAGAAPSVAHALEGPKVRRPTAALTP